MPFNGHITPVNALDDANFVMDDAWIIMGRPAYAPPGYWTMRFNSFGNGDSTVIRSPVAG